MPAYLAKTADGKLWHVSIEHVVSYSNIDWSKPLGTVPVAESTGLGNFTMPYGTKYRATKTEGDVFTFTPLSTYTWDVARRRKDSVAEIKAREQALKMIKFASTVVDLATLVLPMLRVGSVTLRLVLESYLKMADFALKAAEYNVKAQGFDEFDFLVAVLGDTVKDAATKKIFSEVKAIAPPSCRSLMTLYDDGKKQIEAVGKPVMATNALLDSCKSLTESAETPIVAEDAILDGIYRFRLLHDPAFKTAVDTFLQRQLQFQNRLAKAIGTGDKNEILRLQFQMALENSPSVEAFPSPASDNASPVLSVSKGTRGY